MITDELNTVLDWSKLSMRDRAAFIRQAVTNGYKDIDSIHLAYNEYKEGGYKGKTLSDSTVKKAMQFFINKGLTEALAAGLVGNLYRESNLNPKAINPSSKAYGIALWLGPRKKRLFETYGTNPTLQLQLNFVWDELNSTHKNGLRYLMNSKSPEEAAKNAMGYYEFMAGPEGAIREMKRWNLDGERSMALGIKYANLLYGSLQDIPYTHPNVSTRVEPAIEANVVGDRQVLQFNQPFFNANSIPQSTLNNTTLVSNIPATKENVGTKVETTEPTIQGKDLAEVTVYPEYRRPTVPIVPLFMLLPSQQTLIVLTEPERKPISDVLNKVADDRNTLLQKELEDLILYGNLSEDEVERQVEDLLFLRAMSGTNLAANGGRLYPIGGNLIKVNPGDTVPTIQCAKWSNGLLRDSGYLTRGNAWDLRNVDVLFNGFDSIERPQIYDKDTIEQYNHLAADSVYKNFDSKTLDTTKPYVVNMFYNNSPSLKEAYENGNKVTGTHTGVLTYDPDKKKWYVTHNIHGKIYQEPFVSLQNGKGLYGVTAIYQPRENTLWNNVKGFFGFANGGNLFAPGGEIEDEEYKYATTYLPEVTVTAPRYYIEGYDESGNPIYTTDPTKSMGYNAPILQSHLDIQEALKEKPNTGKQWADLATQGIGLALAPIAAAPVVEAGLPIMNTMARPLTTTAKVGSKLFPSWSKALPYTEMADRGIMGYMGARGVYDTGKNWYEGKIPWYQAVPQMGLSGLMMADAAPLMKTGYKRIYDLVNAPKPNYLEFNRDAMYRIIGEEGYHDALATGILRPNMNPNSKHYRGINKTWNWFTKGYPNDREHPVTYANGRRPLDSVYPGNVIVEVSSQHPQFNSFIPHLQDANIYKTKTFFDINSPYIKFYRKGKNGYYKIDNPNYITSPQITPENATSIVSPQNEGLVVSALPNYSLGIKTDYDLVRRFIDRGKLKEVARKMETPRNNLDLTTTFKVDPDKRFMMFEPGKFINYDIGAMSIEQVVNTFGPEAEYYKKLYDVAKAHNFEGKYAKIAQDAEYNILSRFAINKADPDIARGLAEARGIYDIPEYRARFNKWGTLGDTFIEDALTRIDNAKFQGRSKALPIKGQHGVDGAAYTVPHPISPTIGIYNYDSSRTIQDLIRHEANHASHGTLFQPEWMKLHNSKIKLVPRDKNMEGISLLSKEATENLRKYYQDMDEVVERSKTAIEYANKIRKKGETLDDALGRLADMADTNIYDSTIPADIRQMMNTFTKESTLNFWKNFVGGYATPVTIGVGTVYGNSQSQKKYGGNLYNKDNSTL